jgi:hypothetical protein
VGAPIKHRACPAASISVSRDFHIVAQDRRLNKLTSDPSLDDPSPPLGVLSAFTGTFVGSGFNTIFRPNSAADNGGTTFPNPVTPAPPTPPSEQTLELNLTAETLAFSNPLGSVPNRGLEAQGDIFLNGVPYVQTINDVTNPLTGKADGTPSGIHFEPGLWMHVPNTTNDPVIANTLNRMGSIPHGTTINAQCLEPTTTIQGGPQFPTVDITPFVIGSNPPKLIPFAAQTASNTSTPRLPQDLSPFIATGTITQDILTDPNTVLRNAIAGQNITSTIVFTVSTTPTAPFLGGGTANNGFLIGAPPPPAGTTSTTQTGPNADAASMSATFWIETVQQTLTVPVSKAGETLKIQAPTPPSRKLQPTFVVTPPRDIDSPTNITVTNTQIQYSQMVILNFAGLSWPHASVATLVPQAELVVDASVFDQVGTSVVNGTNGTNGVRGE